MTQEEFSHIEISQEEIVETPILSDKEIVLKKLTDLEGWKKDLKKIVIILAALLILLGAYGGVEKILSYDFGIRFHAPVQIITYQKFEKPEARFTFEFPKGFTFDGDEKGKYGADYLAGFYLNADQRTGCDVRSSDVGINFAKNDLEINDAIKNDLVLHVRGLNDFAGKRIKLDGQDAMQADFSLVDPLNNTLHITQIMVSNDDQSYLIACGSGQAQAQFFQKDFQDFIRSFRWKNANV